MLLLTVFATTLLAINDLSGYSAFASPTPQFNSSVDARESLEVAKYRPAHVLCDLREEWRARHCISTSSGGSTDTGGDQEWVDTCKFTNYWGDIQVYFRYSSCDPQQMCQPRMAQDTDDYLPKRTIVCVNRPTSNWVIPPDEYSQIGLYNVVNEGNTVKEIMVSVELKRNLSRSSVTALLEATDANIISAADYAIVSSLRGTTLKLCTYDPRRRQCEPRVPWKLQAGNFVDFTFGLFPKQEARFYYGLFPLWV